MPRMPSSKSPSEVGSTSTIEEASPESNALPSSTAGDVHSLRNPAGKRRRTTPDNTEQEELYLSSSPSGEGENATVRTILRSFTYFVYDGVSATGGYKELARIGKAIVELAVDERYPPPHRSDMSIRRKCTEYLVAPAVSSLTWFILRIVRSSRRKRSSTDSARTAMSLWGKALWAVTHRTGRQALIYRLFFRIGSLRYTLASLLGIICCFFKDTLFPDFFRFRKWPSHFSPSQGLAALFRSAVYAFSFSLPVQNCSKALQDSARRRGNVKKLIFAVILSQIQNLGNMRKLLSTGQYWTL